MKKLSILFSYFLCSIFSLFLFSSVKAQLAEQWILGDWIGYITIDNKPVYKVQINSWENEDNTFSAGTYYYPFTKKGDAFRYDSVKMTVNLRDTSGTFDIAVPDMNGGNYCKVKVTVKRTDLYHTHITTKYEWYQPCQQSVSLFINDWDGMSDNAVFKSAPDIDLKTGKLIPNDAKALTQQNTNVKSQSVPATILTDDKKISSGSAESFDGQWGGYITIKDKPVFIIILKFKSYEKKTVAASYNIYPYGGDTSSLIEKKQLVFNYDKQKNMVYANNDWPAPGGGHCTGYLIIDMDKKDESKVTSKFQLNKNCMDAVMIINKSEYIARDAIFLDHFLKVAQLKMNTPVENNAGSVNMNNSGKTNNKTETVAITKQNADSKKIQSDTLSTFKINSKDVTHPGDKDFKWYEWSKAPKDIIAATHFIHMNNFRDVRPDKILFEEIQKYLAENGTEVRIAAIDLDNDGVCGLAIEVAGSNYCGTMGCTFEFYDNGGLKSIDGITDHGPSPDKNRVKASIGDYYSLRSNKITVDAAEITRLFTYNAAAMTGIQKTNSKTAPALSKRPATASLAGGATVEQLGMQVVKALKTNDRKLWMACIHPDIGYAAPYNNPEILNDYAETFDRMHQYFETHGVAHFDKLTYSITSFDYAGPDKVINMQIEFYYQGKEFLCGVQYGTAKKYKGRFYFESVPHDFAFMRNATGK